MTIGFNETLALPLKWWELTEKVFKDETFDDDEFVELFKETFDVLRHCACEDSVDKELIELIKNVSGFVATRFLQRGYRHLAACELTDAMLTNCLQSETQGSPITNGKWTLLYGEAEIDFTNPEAELFELADYLEDWER